jgi:hypothetical protein
LQDIEAQGGGSTPLSIIHNFTITQEPQTFNLVLIRVCRLPAVDHPPGCDDAGPRLETRNRNLAPEG